MTFALTKCALSTMTLPVKRMPAPPFPHLSYKLNKEEEGRPLGSAMPSLKADLAILFGMITPHGSLKA